MRPDYCYTSWRSRKPREEQPNAIWTFHREGDARSAVLLLRAQGDKVRIYPRTVSVEGCTIEVWCVVIRSKAWKVETV